MSRQYTKTVYGWVPTENWQQYRRGSAIAEMASIGKMLRQPSPPPPSLRAVEEFLSRATGQGDEQLVSDLRSMLERRGGQW